MQTSIRARRHVVIVTVNGEHTYQQAANLAEARRLFAQEVSACYPPGYHVVIVRAINGISIQQDSFEA